MYNWRRMKIGYPSMFLITVNFDDIAKVENELVEM